MKNIKRFVCLTLALMITVSMFVFPASAKTDPRNSVVFIESSFTMNARQGSGFAIGQPGENVQYFVTNCHVIYDESLGIFADEVWIYYSYAENDRVKAKMVVKDIEKDIAVLKIPEPTNKREALVICKNDRVEVGEGIRTYGYPSIASDASSYTEYSKNDIVVDDGVINKIDTVDDKDVYLISANITNGNSGGPLTNEKGQVIGINSFKYITSSDGITTEELKYAIQIDELLRVIDRDEIDYALAGEIDTMLIIIIAAVALVVIAVIILIVVLVKKGKKKKGVASVVFEDVNKNAPAPAGNFNAAPVAPGATAAVKATLICQTGRLAGKMYTISGKSVIGRNPEKCNVLYPTDERGVSGVHCEVISNGAMLTVCDLGSSYGTYLENGQKLAPNTPVVLKNGDKFYVASRDNTFEVRF